MTASPEADRLRAARELFERAQTDSVPMAEAKRRLRQERWAEADRRLAAMRQARPSREPSADPAPEQWWQR